MSITSVLSNIGKGLEKFFTGAIKVAQVAEPIVDIALPGIAILYNATVAAAVSAEAAAIVAGKQTGSGPQKLQYVVTAIENAYNTYAAANNIPVTPAAVTAWANAVVATLNAIPAPSATAPVSQTQITSSAL